jgi:DNA-binding transcriptional regulator YdaS (Cro superfamily)
VSERTLRNWRRTDPTTALQKAIAQAGSQSALAVLLGVSQKTVCSWLRRDIPRKPKEPRNAVERAVLKAGGQPKMAEELGVTQQCISRWCQSGYVPAPRAQEIEITYGVPRAELLNPKLRNALGAGGDL